MLSHVIYKSPAEFEPNVPSIIQPSQEQEARVFILVDALRKLSYQDDARYAELTAPACYFMHISDYCREGNFIAETALDFKDC